MAETPGYLSNGESPVYLRPLVLPVAAREPERGDTADLYLPEHLDGPSPAVLLVHGGPIPPGLEPSPRHWPVFAGYASLLAELGAITMMFDHGLRSPADYPAADADVRAAADALRADPRVDPDRIALWFFSGGSMLCASWLREPPAWLRGLALTYPVLSPTPGWEVDPAYRPVEAVKGAGDLPIVLTRVGRESPAFAEGIAPFVAAAEGGRLEVVDVPEGQHSFDVLDDTDESRAAITRAVDAVLATLR